jgi:hypothetical protein
VLRLVSTASTIDSGKADSRLKIAIFLQQKIFFLEVRHGSPARIRDRHEHVHQPHVGLERGFRFLGDQTHGGAKDRDEE